MSSGEEGLIRVRHVPFPTDSIPDGLISEPLASPDIQEMKQQQEASGVSSSQENSLAKTIKNLSPDYRHGSDVLRGLQGLSGTLPHPTSLSTTPLQERDLLRARIRKTIHDPESPDGPLFDASNVYS